MLATGALGVLDVEACCGLRVMWASAGSGGLRSRVLAGFKGEDPWVHKFIRSFVFGGAELMAFAQRPPGAQ